MISVNRASDIIESKTNDVVGRRLRHTSTLAMYNICYIFKYNCPGGRTNNKYIIHLLKWPAAAAPNRSSYNNNNNAKAAWTDIVGIQQLKFRTGRGRTVAVSRLLTVSRYARSSRVLEQTFKHTWGLYYYFYRTHSRVIQMSEQWIEHCTAVDRRTVTGRRPMRFRFVYCYGSKSMV